MNNIYYIIIDNNNTILGLYNNINISLNSVLDMYILQFNSILDVIKQNKFFKLSHISNRYKIKSMIINSNSSTKEIYFCFKKFIFFDTDNKTNYILENDFNYNTKINQIKSIYNNIIDKNNETELNIFIPNDIFTDNNNIIPHNIDTVNYENNYSPYESNNYTNLNNFNNDIEYNNFIYNKESNNIQGPQQNNELEQNNEPLQNNNDTKKKLINIEKKKLLIEKIKNLEEKDKNINNKITNLKKNISDSEIYINNNNDITKKLEHINKVANNLNNLKSKFNANQEVYNKIKNKINNKEIEIPDLFKIDFMIFKHLEDNNIVNYDEKLNYYIEKYPKEINYHYKYDLDLN